MDIRIQVMEIIVCMHTLRLKPPLKKSPGSFVSLINIHSIPCKQFLHKQTNATLGDLSDQQMEMIRHQAVRSDSDQGLSSIKRKDIPIGSATSFQIFKMDRFSFIT